MSLGTAIGIGFKALGALSKKGKSTTLTPLQLAAKQLATQEYQPASIGTPGRPDTGNVARVKGSEEIYDYYRMIATAKLVAERLDPEAGTKVGKLGAIKASALE